MIDLIINVMMIITNIVHLNIKILVLLALFFFLGVPSPFFPGIILSRILLFRKPPETPEETDPVFEKSDG